MFSQVTETPRFAELANLSIDRLKQLETTLASILASPNAQDTYAQIIDGRATWQSHVDPNTRGFPNETIIVSDHPTPSDGAMQLYEEIRTVFTPQALKIDVQLAQNYQNAPLGSPEHDLRLLEITAASLNALAGMIYASFHPETVLKPQESPSAQQDLLFFETDQFYVDFYHTKYKEFERYPFGLLNVVGYWAETQLFGGVLLFDRGESGREINNAFLHPPEVFYCYQLSSHQIACFSTLSKPKEAGQLSGAENPLPFTQEPNAHLENTWVRKGEAPLRIYKNDYDKPPPSWVPAHPSCTQTHDEGLLVSFDEARGIVKEKGWDRLEPQDYDLVALQNSHPFLSNMYPVRDDASK
ncbi:hypothetical protein HO133_004895 [Letharia lupina]|uniref:Uncharacterized protein n=1 Tax=Letharia lupina TaxID=560253 RepID=A0A8H6L036_9LECA|nr:uncharacterized protein HO133_004895 [Letharia lupina]KAF6230551.1 hypothetical protein HO133_004895 [Letharia lupina]